MVEDDDYGDGVDLFLIVIGMFVVCGVVVGLGIIVVFVMDKFIEDSLMFWLILFGICMVMFWVGNIWMWIVVFCEGIGYGIGCLLCGCY